MKYTYYELSNYCDSYFNNLSDEAQYRFIVDGDYTFEMYVLGKIKEWESVFIDNYTYTYEIMTPLQLQANFRIKSL